MKKNLCLLRLPVLSAFFLVLLPSSLWATDVEFVSHGVTWTGDASKVYVSNAIYSRWNGTLGWEFMYRPSYQTMGLRNNVGAISVKSSFLRGVTSITFRVARTSETYEETNHIHIQSYICAESADVINNSNWEECMDVNAISYVIDETIAETMSSGSYNPDPYDEVIYNFPSPLTGYIRLYVEQTLLSSYSAYCYLLIPEISVTYADPSAPSPCPNCFLVTF